MKLDIKTAIILIAILLVATVGSAYVTSWVFSNRAVVPAIPMQGGGAAETIPFNPQLMWHAGVFTVNLARTGNLAPFVRMEMSFRVNEQRTISELERRRVQVRDRVITILRTTTAQELQETEGISKLKQRIMDTLNELIEGDGGRIFEVYLTELVIQ